MPFSIYFFLFLIFLFVLVLLPLNHIYRNKLLPPHTSDITGNKPCSPQKLIFSCSKFCQIFSTSLNREFLKSQWRWKPETVVSFIMSLSNVYMASPQYLPPKTPSCAIYCATAVRWFCHAALHCAFRISHFEFR